MSGADERSADVRGAEPAEDVRWMARCLVLVRRERAAVETPAEEAARRRGLYPVPTG